MSRPQPYEFLSLPYFNWIERPPNSPLYVEEAATALYLSDGDVVRAAERLRVPPARLQREIRKSPRLIRLQVRLNDAHIA